MRKQKSTYYNLKCVLSFTHTLPRKKGGGVRVNKGEREGGAYILGIIFNEHFYVKILF